MSSQKEVNRALLIKREKKKKKTIYTFKPREKKANYFELHFTAQKTSKEMFCKNCLTDMTRPKAWLFDDFLRRY